MSEKFSITIHFTDGKKFFLDDCDRDVSDMEKGYVKVVRGNGAYTFFTHSIQSIHFLEQTAKEGV